MLELALAHINHAERERKIVTDLRHRQLLKAPDGRSMPAPASSAPMSRPRTVALRVPIAER